MIHCAVALDRDKILSRSVWIHYRQVHTKSSATHLCVYLVSLVDQEAPDLFFKRRFSILTRDRCRGDLPCLGIRQKLLKHLEAP